MTADNEHGWATAAGIWIDRHKVLVALAFSALGLVFLGDLWGVAFDDKQAWWARALAGLLSLGIVGATIYGLWGQSAVAAQGQKDAAEKERMREVLEALGLDYFDLWKNRLRQLGDELNFDGADRISVYRFEDGKFTMVGRFSERPEFDAPGRSVYPADQGVIGRAWAAASGSAAVLDFPDPTEDYPAYRAANQQHWGLPLGVIDRLKMKPRSICAHVLKHPKTGARIAIIVFESERQGRFSAEDIATLCGGRHGQEISQFLDRMKIHEPELAFAKERGF